MSSLAHAAPHAVGGGLQEEVADRVAERIVDALEVVEVEAEDADRLGAPPVRQDLFHALVEGSAVQKIGECVVVGEVPDLLLGEPPLGDVLEGRDEAPVGYRPIVDGDASAVGQVLDHRRRLVLADVLLRQGERAFGVDVVRPRAFRQHRGNRHAGLEGLGRHPVDLRKSRIGDHQLAVGVEHAEALGHVGQRGVQPELALPDLPPSAQRQDDEKGHRQSRRAAAPPGPPG